MRRPGAPVRPGAPSRVVLDRGCACVNVLISATVRSEWATDKFQCHGDSVVRFGPGTAAAARPRQWPAAAVPAGSGPARGDTKRPAARRRAAALTPGAAPGAGHL